MSHVPLLGRFPGVPDELLCCSRPTLRALVRGWFASLRWGSRFTSACVIPCFAGVIVYLSLVYFLLVHAALFRDTAESAAFALVALYLLLGIVYLWATTIYSDPGYAAPAERLVRSVDKADGDGVVVVDHADETPMMREGTSDADEPGESAGDTSDAGDAGDSLARAKRLARARPCDACRLDRGLTIHHCRVCSRCVHGMDHHCVFVANCVGARNRGRFLLLLLYVVVGCAYSACAGAALLARRNTAYLMYTGATASWRNLAVVLVTHSLAGADVHIAAAAVLSAAWALTFGVLLCWNFYLALLGATMIDLFKAFGATHWRAWRRIAPLLVPRDIATNLDAYMQPMGARPRALVWFLW